MRKAMSKETLGEFLAILVRQGLVVADKMSDDEGQKYIKNSNCKNYVQLQIELAIIGWSPND